MLFEANTKIFSRSIPSSENRYIVVEKGNHPFGFKGKQSITVSSPHYQLIIREIRQPFLFAIWYEGAGADEKKSETDKNVKTKNMGEKESFIIDNVLESCN